MAFSSAFCVRQKRPMLLGFSQETSCLVAARYCESVILQ
jgi:hypothetical protein